MYKHLPIIFLVASIISCNNTETTTPAGPIPGAIPAPQAITFTVDSVYPHDPKAFTQGLELYKGKLYEGTGLNEESNLRITDIKTGKVEKNYHIADTSIFGEGITIFKEKIYQLTWVNHKVFVYDVSDITKPIKTLSWPHEGWGITHDNEHLIISDGSTNIYFVSPDDLRIIKTISVADNTGPEDRLNELELINGSLFANRWETDEILKIDTANGHVTGKMNLAGLLGQYAPKEITSETNVLNGIAYDSTTKKLYITGKKWPKMFEMHLN